MGQSAVASGSEATAIGQNSTASGANATAVGQGSTASGQNSAAFGENSSATGAFSTALGQSATASGTNSTAVGNGSSAGFANSAAFGNGATATRANQQVFGTANNTYTMSGVASNASRAAQTGPIQVVTSDLNGNLATDNGAIFHFINNFNDHIDRVEQGVAMAMALPGVGFLPDNKRFAINGSWGTFAGSHALAASGAFKITDWVQVDAGVAVGLTQSEVAGRAGVTFAW
jgi:autotransporter adhesin